MPQQLTTKTPQRRDEYWLLLPQQLATMTPQRLAETIHCLHDKASRSSGRGGLMQETKVPESQFSGRSPTSLCSFLWLSSLANPLGQFSGWSPPVFGLVPWLFLPVLKCAFASTSRLSGIVLRFYQLISLCALWTSLGPCCLRLWLPLFCKVVT